MENLKIDGQYHDIEVKKLDEDIQLVFDGMRFDINENEFELIIKHYQEWKMKK